MAEHEPSIGQSDDWYTPPEIFTALGLPFDLDPCSPGPGHWVPAKKIYTKADDGLRQPWFGRVFMNPPFGCRNGHVPWLIKFLDHGNGVAIVRAYTSSAWFHEYAVRAETMLFPKGKTKFHRPDGSIGTAPGHGIVLLGMGEVCNAALRWSELGLFIDLRVQTESVREPSPPPPLPAADGLDIPTWLRRAAP
jgi:DNA N-6-adenine-methyltransferase (Dam)